MNFSSKLLEDVVESLGSLPGIGKKTALRLALHLERDNLKKGEKIAESITQMKELIKRCTICNNLSDSDTCNICTQDHRKKEVLCVVESVRDVMAIEDTAQFSGLYHVLGGKISPLEGVGPEDLSLDLLQARVAQGQIKEIVMAISPSIEGETTIYYISKLIADMDVSISVIARGVAFGGELEYADEITLGRSIESRIPYQLKI
jgi:recombination protein RecR